LIINFSRHDIYLGYILSRIRIIPYLLTFQLSLLHSMFSWTTHFYYLCTIHIIHFICTSRINWVYRIYHISFIIESIVRYELYQINVKDIIHSITKDPNIIKPFILW